MARPPVEWPIPVYVTELRERMVASYRIPARLLAGRVPAPLAPELVRGEAVVALCFGNGRCLKPAGGETVLASEFGLAEVVTPVRWQGACRAPVRGLYLLHLFTDCPGVRRLLRAALEIDAERVEPIRGTDRGVHGGFIRSADRMGDAALCLRRPVEEASWNSMLFPVPEEAEAALLHPEAYFVPGRDGRVVRAVPVHQYARAVVPATVERAAAPLLAELLGAVPGEVSLDHVLFQKRCTHTWLFPPERIPVADRRAPRIPRAGGAEGVLRLAA